MAIKVSMTELLLFEAAVWRSHHQVLSFIILWRKGALFISFLELLVVPSTGVCITYKKIYILQQAHKVKFENQ